MYKGIIDVQDRYGIQNKALTSFKSVILPQDWSFFYLIRLVDVITPTLSPACLEVKMLSSFFGHFLIFWSPCIFSVF